jgi:predicted site-specific integrase-resolvase
MDAYHNVREVACLFGVNTAKVRAWIAAGELKAIIVATRVGGRPRWRIPPSSVAEFTTARSPHRPAPTARRRRPAANVTQYF